MKTTSIRYAMLATLPLVLVAACGDRSPPPASAPTGAPPAQSSSTAPAKQEPIVPPNTAADVESKKGTETGMVGGASGDVASGGKPGSGTVSGGGTGAAESSGTRTENKK